MNSNFNVSFPDFQKYLECFSKDCQPSVASLVSEISRRTREEIDYEAIFIPGIVSSILSSPDRLYSRNCLNIFFRSWPKPKLEERKVAFIHGAMAYVRGCKEAALFLGYIYSYKAGSLGFIQKDEMKALSYLEQCANMSFPSGLNMLLRDSVYFVSRIYKEASPDIADRALDVMISLKKQGDVKACYWLMNHYRKEVACEDLAIIHAYELIKMAYRNRANCKTEWFVYAAQALVYLFDQSLRGVSLARSELTELQNSGLNSSWGVDGVMFDDLFKKVHFCFTTPGFYSKKSLDQDLSYLYLRAYLRDYLPSIEFEKYIDEGDPHAIHLLGTDQSWTLYSGKAKLPLVCELYLCDDPEKLYRKALELENSLSFEFKRQLSKTLQFYYKAAQLGCYKSFGVLYVTSRDVSEAHKTIRLCDTYVKKLIEQNPNLAYLYLRELELKRLSAQKGPAIQLLKKLIEVYLQSEDDPKTILAIKEKFDHPTIRDLFNLMVKESYRGAVELKLRILVHLEGEELDQEYVELSKLLDELFEHDFSSNMSSQIYQIYLKCKDRCLFTSSLILLGLYELNINSNPDKYLKYLEGAAMRGDWKAALRLAQDYAIGVIDCMATARKFAIQKSFEKVEKYSDIVIMGSVLLSAPERSKIYVQFGQIILTHFPEKAQRAYDFFKESEQLVGVKAYVRYNMGQCYLVEGTSIYDPVTGYNLILEAFQKGSSEAVSWLQAQAAEVQALQVQIDLAQIYFNQKNYEESIRFWLMAAAQDYIEAYRKVALIYHDYLNNIQKCLFYNEKAAALGHHEARQDLAIYYWEEGDFEKAYYHYKILAQEPNAKAVYSFKLGCLLADDMVFAGPSPIHYTYAFHAFKKAAEQGHIDAQFRLAQLYLEGRGTVRNKKEALKWLRLAQSQGNSSAKALYKQLMMMSSSSKSR